MDPAPAGISCAADIQPHFNSNCMSCHGAGGGPAGVRLNSYANVMAGGNGCPLVVAVDSSHPDATLVPQMKDGHQGASHGTNIIQDIKDWIDAGALES